MFFSPLSFRPLSKSTLPFFLHCSPLPFSPSRLPAGSRRPSPFVGKGLGDSCLPRSVHRRFSFSSLLSFLECGWVVRCLSPCVLSCSFSAGVVAGLASRDVTSGLRMRPRFVCCAWVDFVLRAPSCFSRLRTEFNKKLLKIADGRAKSSLFWTDLAFRCRNIEECR